jgi:TRAP-type C4-dicarboxylate transport system substrate-binding protein
MRKFSTLRNFAASAVALTVVAFSGTAAVAQDAVTLRMVGAWAPGISPYADVGHKFKDLVNELSGGNITVQYIGAEDVLPPFDQPEALINGVFDIWYGAPNYWASVVPGGYVTELSQFETPDNGPGSELYEFMVKMYEPHGVRYLAHAAGAVGVGSHFLHAQKKVSGVDDLKGVKLRVPPLTRYFVQSVGAESITLAPSEIFIAMDRGTVDGFTWPVADGFANYGWQTVTKYMINTPMYRSGVAIDMNLDSWNNLSPEQQDIITKAAAETQAWTRGWFAEKQDEQIAKMKEGGMELVDLSAEEAARWTDVAQESLWGYLQTVMDPEEFATAERLLERKKN